MKKQMNNQKGFTLVELIVVIVLIGILAAITVPALIGYLDKGDEAQDDVDARTAYVAAQTVITEKRIKSTTDSEFTALTAADFEKLDGDNAVYNSTAPKDGEYTITYISLEGEVGIEYNGKYKTDNIKMGPQPTTPPAGE